MCAKLSTGVPKSHSHSAGLIWSSSLARAFIHKVIKSLTPSFYGQLTVLGSEAQAATLDNKEVGIDVVKNNGIDVMSVASV